MVGGGGRHSQMHTPHMGLRVLQAVIHYLHDYIPFGHTKEVITTITLEASARDVKRELSRFSNKMTPTDNPDAAVAPFPHVLTHSQIREMQRGKGQKASMRERGKGSLAIRHAGGEKEREGGREREREKQCEH